MRDVPKTKGLNGCPEVRGFSHFQVLGLVQLACDYRKCLSQAQLITENHRGYVLDSWGSGMEDLLGPEGETSREFGGCFKKTNKTKNPSFQQFCNFIEDC